MPICYSNGASTGGRENSSYTHSTSGRAPPVTLEADGAPVTQQSSLPATGPETLNISCEVTFRHGTLRLNGAVSEGLLTMLIRELKQ